MVDLSMVYDWKQTHWGRTYVSHLEDESQVPAGWRGVQIPVGGCCFTKSKTDWQQFLLWHMIIVPYHVDGL